MFGFIEEIYQLFDSPSVEIMLFLAIIIIPLVKWLISNF